jgi:hypothetical protein
MPADLSGEVLPPATGTNVAAHSREFCPWAITCKQHRPTFREVPRIDMRHLPRSTLNREAAA